MIRKVLFAVLSWSIVAGPSGCLMMTTGCSFHGYAKESGFLIGDQTAEWSADDSVPPTAKYWLLTMSGNGVSVHGKWDGFKIAEDVVTGTLEAGKRIVDTVVGWFPKKP